MLEHAQIAGIGREDLRQRWDGWRAFRPGPHIVSEVT
jgi:hypothetical protein